MRTNNCPNCNTPCVFDSNVHTLNITYQRCPACKLRFVTPGDSWYLDYSHYSYPDVDTALNEASILHNRFEVIINKYQPERLGNPFSLLDIGCGNGMFLSCVHKKYPEHAKVMGIDPAEESSQRAKELGIDVKQASFLDYDFSGKTFDIITIFGNLMLHEDPFATLHRAASLLNSGGILVFDVKNGECSIRRMARLGNRLFPDRIPDGIIRAAFHGMRYQFNKSMIVGLLPELGKPLFIRTFPPRALFTESQTTYSKGIGRMIIHTFNYIDRIINQQSWIETAFIKEPC